jgi:putative hydrolase of the HAD superfamily
VFDIGGVLFEWRPVEVMKNLKRIDKDIPHNIVDITRSQVWRDFDKGFATIEDIAHTFSDSFRKQHIDMFIQAALDSIIPMEHGLNLWYAAKKHNYKIFILSNLPFVIQKNIFATYPFILENDGAIFSCDVGMIKPEKGIYDRLLQDFNLIPHETIFIDDMEENIHAAKEAGIHGILCDTHHNVTTTLKDLNIIHL